MPGSGHPRKLFIEFHFLIDENGAISTGCDTETLRMDRRPRIPPGCVACYLATRHPVVARSFVLVQRHALSALPPAVFLPSLPGWGLP